MLLACLRQDALIPWNPVHLGTCVLLLLVFFQDSVKRCFSPCLAVSAPRYLGSALARRSSTWSSGLAGWWTLHKPVSLSGRCGFGDLDHLECSEKKCAIASNQGIWKKHYGVGGFFFFFEPVCKTLEKILSKYVQLDQACLVVKREFIRKYSGNNKHH